MSSSPSSSHHLVSPFTDNDHSPTVIAINEIQMAATNNNNNNNHIGQYGRNDQTPSDNSDSSDSAGHMLHHRHGTHLSVEEDEAFSSRSSRQSSSFSNKNSHNAASRQNMTTMNSDVLNSSAKKKKFQRFRKLNIKKRLFPWDPSSLIYDNAVLNAYVEDNKLPKSKIPDNMRISHKERFVLYLKKHGYMRDLEIFQALIAVLLTLIYIVESYLAMLKMQHILALAVIDLSLCGFITIIFMGHLIMAKRKLKFLILNPYSYLDYVTVLPIILMYVLIFSMPKNYITTVIGVFRVFRLLRLLLVVKAYPVYGMRNVYRQVFILVLTLLSLIFLFASLIQTVENYFTSQNLYFHDSVYFIWVTMTTIGYGDISPKSIYGKACVILFFVIGVIVIPYQTTQIFNIVTAKENVFKWLNMKLKNHMIVTGTSRYAEVVEFTKEFFHEQHGKIKPKKLLFVFRDKELCDHLQSMADNPYYSTRVSVYNGDIVDFETLTLVKAHNALGVFVLTKHNSANPRLEDTNTLMITLAVKNFNPKLDVFAQAILPESKNFIVQAGASSVVCTEDLKQKLMALSVVCPGLCTLVSNLVTSVAVRNPMQIFERKLKHKQAEESDRWMYEYFAGTSKEIYMVVFSPYFVDTLFLDASLSAYQELEMILFAIFSEEKKCVLMNPSDYLIKEGDQAIVIAESIFQAQLINLYKCDKIVNIQEPERTSFDVSAIHKHSGPYVASANINTLDDDREKGKVEEDDYFFYNEQNEFELCREEPGDVDKRKSRMIRHDRSMEDLAGKEASTTRSKIANDMINQRQVNRLLRHIAPIADVKNFFGAKNKTTSGALPNTMRGFRDDTEKKFFGKALESFNLLHVARSMDDFVLKNQQLSNHVIVTGSLKGSAYISLTLRSSTHQKFAPIVFLSPDENLLPFLYERLKFFDHVYFMQGSPTERYDLRKAGAADASCVLYLSDFTEDGLPEDSEAVKCMLGLRWIEKKTRYLCEISNKSNIKFFKPSTAYTGERFSKYINVLDSVTSEAIVDDETERFERMCMISEVFSSGRVFPNSIFARLLCQTYYNSRIVGTIEVICGFSGLLAKDQSSIFQISCPEELAGKTFHDAFLFFYRHDSICLGLYRPKHVLGNSNRLEYVYTHPETNTVLCSEDRFYVVGNHKRLYDVMNCVSSKMKVATTRFADVVIPREDHPLNLSEDVINEVIDTPSTIGLSPTSPKKRTHIRSFSVDTSRNASRSQ